MQPLTSTDPQTHSLDLIAANVALLKALFPEIVVEGKIDFDILKQLLGGEIDGREEKYGLIWHGKRRARQLALTPSTGTLRPCPDESVDWETTQNLMIEGDNLEVLKLLQKSYAGKVKLIYIDPPYNTGNDFVYPDDFRDNIRNYKELTGQTEGGRRVSSNTEASGRFHTDWLNMIWPRLSLARNLLRNDGIVLISIDDSEVKNLRALCDEVFHEENFVATMIWEKGRKNDARLISVGHEYILVYAKSISNLREKNTIWREEKPGSREIWEQYLQLRAKHGTDNGAIEHDLSLWYSSLPHTHPAKKWSRYKRVDENGPWRDRDISWPGGGGPRYDVIHPITGKPCKVPERGWIYASPEEMQRQIDLGLVEFRQDHSEPPFRKAHIRPIQTEVVDAEAGEDVESLLEEDSEEFATQVRGSYFYKQSQVSVKHLRKLLGAKVFNNPKDHLELARLFDYVTSGDKGAIVLDFFAGSASSGHAVMELNQADMGKRRFVLVQLPEPLDTAHKDQKAAALYCDKIGKPRNIAELSKERLRRAAAGLKSENPMFAGDTGFRVFKLDSSNIRAWEPAPENLGQSLLEHAQHLKSDRTEYDILYELLLKFGLDLCIPVTVANIAGSTVYSVGGGVLLVCLAASIQHRDTEMLAQGMIAWHKELAPAGDTTCIFRDSAFADDVAKMNLTAILQQHGLENVRSL